MASGRSFAQRMASRISNATIENWDEDSDFQGDIFTQSMSTVKSMSSHLSVRSESNTGDDDWQLLIAPNDDLSTAVAITSAKQAGIPIPTSVPSSALLGGTIHRLGKKKSSRKIDVEEDWGNDLELPTNPSDGLKLKPLTPRTPADDQDEFDDWGEGSLGIRFGGTRREARGGRGSSASAMSPSLGSIMTLESEDDDLSGLVLPFEQLDFGAKLEKLRKTDYPTPDASPLPMQLREPPPTSAPAPQLAPSPFPPPISTPPLEHGPAPELAPKLRHAEEEDDFLNDLDFGGAEEAIDTKKLTLNRNVVVKKQASKPSAPAAAKPATTLTFVDKPSVSRIPRPLPSASRTRLAPVYESGASNMRQMRPMPTTTSAQLLRAKRSAPVLRNNNPVTVSRPPVPFLPAGNANSQSHHVKARTSQPHLRRDSDPRRPLSPSMRVHSRMGSINPPETPNGAGFRRDVAPAPLVREGALRQTLSKPRGPKKLFGDGTELELFDDLPTSASKEKAFEKAPRNQPSNKSLRHVSSNARLPMPERMVTPQPQTPKSPPRDSTPRFARDTAASRNAREQRLAGTRSRGEGSVAPTPTNWKAQVAARSPHASPYTHRKRGSGQKPMLIKAMSAPQAKNEKGMVYNPSLQRWEGNEDALVPFSHPNTSTTTLALTTASTPTFAPPNHSSHPQHERSHSISHTALSAIHAKNLSSRATKVAPVAIPSPPRPALISQGTQPRTVQVERGMVFDPVKMSWMKMPRATNGDLRSPPADLDDLEDPFAGIEDLKDDNGSTFGASGRAGDPSNLNEGAFVGEEFDLGPSFIRRQQDEEKQWKRRTDQWVSHTRDNGETKHGGWRWHIRNLAALASAEASRR